MKPVKFTGVAWEVAQKALNYLSDQEGDFQVDIKPYKEERSLDQNGLYWMWLTIMAKHFSRPGKKITKEDMHDMMRFKFLGLEDKVVGKTVIEGQLKSTKKLNTGEFSHYLNQIEMWCTDLGLILPVPMGSYYYELKNRQDA